jgi:hypothetical protein
MTNPIRPADKRQAALSILAQLSELIVIYSTTNAPGVAAYVERVQKLRAKLARALLGSSRKPPHQPKS